MLFMPRSKTTSFSKKLLMEPKKKGVVADEAASCTMHRHAIKKEKKAKRKTPFTAETLFNQVEQCSSSVGG